MLQIIQNQLLFYVTITLVLFVPGYFLLRLVNSRKEHFSKIEIFVFSLPISIIIIDFLMIFYSWMGIAYTRWSLVLGILIFATTIIFFQWYWAGKGKDEIGQAKENKILLNFSRKQFFLVLLILFFSIFIRLAYLSNSAVPTSTDLGHHMYWSKAISTSGSIVEYQEREIIESDGGYALSEPKPIADFIIGEHLIFSAVNLISGWDYLSAFPMIILLIINLAILLVFFVVSLRIFSDQKNRNVIAIFVIFLLGPLFALASPQAKFVSGGVVGNVIGNLLIPVALYFLYRALAERDRTFFALFILSAGGLIYSHHLSTLVLIFIILFSVAIYLAYNFKKWRNYIGEWLALILGKIPILLILLILAFIIFLYTPTYLNPSAVDTAIGSPEKTTRVGLTFSQLAASNSEIKLALALAAVAYITFSFRKKFGYGHAILTGWTLSILVMTLKPNWLFLDIPSNRIGAYAYFPLALLAAYAISQLVELKKSGELKMGKYFLAIVLIYLVYFGMVDNSDSAKTEAKVPETLATFLASDYLAEKTTPADGIIKDHNYLIADSWIKLFFMRGYGYPLSRGYFKRYEDEFNQREQCTLWMISAPESDEAKKCYSGTGTRYIMVNGMFDSAQFNRSADFDKIYDSGNVTIFMKK